MNSAAKKKTVAQCLLDAQIIYDTNTKRCRESKRKSPAKAKKSPAKAKKSPAKAASKAKKKTVAQLKKECKEQGLVYDAKTKKCRESKRKKKSKSPPKHKKMMTTEEWLKSLEDKASIFENGFDRRDDEERWMETQDSFGPDEISRTEWVKLGQSKAGGGHALTPSSDVAYEILEKFVKKKKKSPAKAKKSPAKAKKGRKSPTESATLNNVGTRKTGNDGNMWEVVTNKNGTKRWKKDTKKKKRKVPQFFDAWTEVNPGYSDWDYGTGIEPEEEAVTKYIRDTGKITGDIIYIGSSYESRQEYGIIVVDLNDKKRLFTSTEDFYYLNPSSTDDDEIIKELTADTLLKNSKKAVEEFIAWYKEDMM